MSGTIQGTMTEERNGAADDKTLNDALNGQDHGGQQQGALNAQNDDDGDINAAFERVKSQLEEEKRARLAAETGRRQAEDAGRRYQQEAAQGHVSVKQANLHAIDRAIEANASSIVSLRSALSAAMSNGDFDQAAEVQAQLSEMAARKVQLEAGKYQLQNTPDQPAPQQQMQQSDPFEAQLERYTPRTRDWIRKRPEVLRDERTTNLAVAAHHTALAAGHVADSDAYFDAMDAALGYKQGNQQSQQQPRRPGTAAPPARSGTPGQRAGQGMSVRDMTPAMVEAAKMADISPEEYLKHYQAAVAAGEIPAIH
ncbi:MAG TPA: hypothetical protein PKX13_12020 [Acidiphilium sp.]|nr:MAG: hypothetical protein B7Z68_00710 [Acidobacteria bacterium 21-70-11]HQU24995.1 hypothetical protein [Acidiphilium sp.]